MKGLLAAAVVATALAVPASASAADPTIQAATAAYNDLGITQLAGMPSGRTTYRTYADYNNEMAALAAANPDLVAIKTAPYLTTQGREVKYVEITNNVNARIWGWHTIGRRVGADFPLLQWQLATGQDVGACRAPARLRWLRLSTDVAASVPAILGGELSVRSYLGTLVGRHERALFAADDMLPGMLDIPLAALQEAAVRMHRPDRQPISSHILARLRVQSPVQEAQIPAPATPPDTGMSRPAPR